MFWNIYILSYKLDEAANKTCTHNSPLTEITKKELGNGLKKN